jgi:hypothetical protein
VVKMLILEKPRQFILSEQISRLSSLGYDEKTFHHETARKNIATFDW